MDERDGASEEQTEEQSEEQTGQDAEELSSGLNGRATGAGGDVVEETLVEDEDEWDDDDAWGAWDEDDVKAYEQGWRRQRVVFTLLSDVRPGPPLTYPRSKKYDMGPDDVGYGGVGWQIFLAPDRTVERDALVVWNGLMEIEGWGRRQYAEWLTWQPRWRDRRTASGKLVHEVLEKSGWRIFRVPAEPRYPPSELIDRAAYGVVGEVVRAVSARSEADPAAIIVQFLAAFGSLVGRRAYFPAERDRHYPNLFAVLVGETSRGRKGASWGQAIRVFENLSPQVDEWLANCTTSGLSSGEGLIHALRDRATSDDANGPASAPPTGGCSYARASSPPCSRCSSARATRSPPCCARRGTARHSTFSPSTAPRRPAARTSPSSGTSPARS
jgi:hypothetical protein